VDDADRRGRLDDGERRRPCDGQAPDRGALGGGPALDRLRGALPERPGLVPSRLRDAAHPLPPGGGPHRRRLRVLLRAGHHGSSRLRSFGCDRLLGQDQPSGLVRLRARPEGRRVEGLHGWPLLAGGDRHPRLRPDGRRAIHGGTAESRAGLGVSRIAESFGKVGPAPRRIETEVIVIGGGIAGLTAATELAAAGSEVLVLEARDRVGGRTWNTEIGGEANELGGQWVAPYQSAMHELLADLDIELFDTFRTGQHVFVDQQGRSHRYDGHDAPLGERSEKAFEAAESKLDSL